jgi:hypothetical protein
VHQVTGRYTASNRYCPSLRTGRIVTEQLCKSPSAASVLSVAQQQSSGIRVGSMSIAHAADSADGQIPTHSVRSHTAGLRKRKNGIVFLRPDMECQRHDHFVVWRQPPLQDSPRLREQIVRMPQYWLHSIDTRLHQRLQGLSSACVANRYADLEGDRVLGWVAKLRTPHE